jgi:hypothetical protein
MLGLGFVQGGQGDWAAQAELGRAALQIFDEFGAERPRFLAHVRILAAERELGRLGVAARHARIAWEGLTRLGRAEPYVLSDLARETAMLLAVSAEPAAAAVVFGWQRALIRATGALEDQPEVAVVDRTLELLHGALPAAEVDAAVARGAASDDASITRLALAALERLDGVRASPAR